MFGAVGLLLMALLSSVDRSIVYILLGISAYSIFLGFYLIPRSPSRHDNNFFAGGSAGKSQSAPRGRTYSSPSPTLADFITGFSNFITEFSSRRSSPYQKRNPIKIFLLIFVAVFTLPILISLFSDDSPSNDAMSYFDQGEQFYSAEQFDSAAISYRKALRASPDFEGALLGYGKTLSALGQCDSANLMFDKVLEINSNNVYATYNKAYCSYKNKQYADGSALLEPLLENNSDYYDAMLLLGDCYYAANENDKALKQYEKAYEEGGERSYNLAYIMGYLYDVSKNFDKAIPKYQEALTYDSTQFDLYRRLGELIEGNDGSYYRAKALQLKQP